MVSSGGCCDGGRREPKCAECGSKELAYKIITNLEGRLGRIYIGNKDGEMKEKEQHWINKMWACSEHLKEVAEMDYSPLFSSLRGSEREVRKLEEDGKETLIATLEPKPRGYGVMTYKLPKEPKKGAKPKWL